MIQPLEFKREYLHNNPHSEIDVGLETMIDAALKYDPFSNVTYCTLFRPALNGCDMKVLAKYAEAEYSIAIQTAHHCDDTDDVEVTVCYYYWM